MRQWRDRPAGEGDLEGVFKQRVGGGQEGLGGKGLEGGFEGHFLKDEG